MVDLSSEALQEMNPKLRREIARRVLARRSLIEFTKRFLPTYNPGWVHNDIARRLEHFKNEVEAQKSPRLMLLVPPRHGKSELGSVRWSGWCIGHHPEWEIINCGYNLDLPMKFSRKVREMIRDPAFTAVFSGCEIDKESQSAEAWNTTMGGGFTAAGVGGGITGKGAHILVVDDPIKNQTEADSIVTRDSLWDWYWSTAYSRLSPGGGVLLIQTCWCLAGSTLINLADGTQKRIDRITPGERVQTWDDGKLTTEVVTRSGSNGYDQVYDMTTTSGKVVRANGKHPFLVQTGGEVEWVQLKNLKLGQRIVTSPDSGGNTKGWSVGRRIAVSLRSAGAFVMRTTRSGSGRLATALRQRSNQNENITSNGGISSRLRNMTHFWLRRVIAVLSASFQPTNALNPSIGSSPCASTTATRPRKSEGYCVTAATCSSSEANQLPASSGLLPTTSSFTTEEIAAIIPRGREEVFDLTVNRTHNFIANGCVTHNSDDDLAGRLQQRMADAALDPEAHEDIDNFTVIKYPAEALEWEYHNKVTDLIERFDHPLAPEHVELRTEQRERGVSIPNVIDSTYDLLRMPGEALHPERFTEKMIRRLKANQPPRVWSALYQQNPVPDEGIYFRQEYFRYEPTPPGTYNRKVFQAWDFAIGVKQQNDFTVGVTLIQDEEDCLHVVEVVRFKGDSFTIVEEILDAAVRWGSDRTAPLTIGFEDGQIWKSIKPLLSKRMRERQQYPPYQVLSPLTDKIARARPLQGRMQQHRVYFPANAPWLPLVLKELLRFPAGAHDDIVDAMAWAVTLAVGSSPPKGAKPPTMKSWKDKLKTLGGDGAGHMAA